MYLGKQVVNKGYWRGGEGGMWGLSVLSVQLFCKSRTKKVY